MSKKANPQFTDGMVRFGRYLKLLRCPDYHKYKVMVLRQLQKLGLCGDFDPNDVDDVEKHFSFVADEDLPKTFRSVQLISKKYKLRILSLREAAYKLEISKNTLNDYEQGKRYPSIEFIYEYSDKMQYPIDPLLEQWLKNHPNKYIQEHAEMRLEEHYFHNLSTSNYKSQRIATRAFFEQAMSIALSGGRVMGLADEAKNNVATVFAEIADGVMTQGLELAPENISMKLINQAYESIK